MTGYARVCCPDDDTTLIQEADLHIHSHFSFCSLNKPESILRKAISVGLDIIAVTDHNTIKGSQEVTRLAQGDERISIIISSEVSTDRGDLIGLFLLDEIKSTRFEDVADEIHDQGGLTMLPHPFDTNRRSACFPTAEDARLFDAVEIQNGRYSSDKPVELASAYATTHNIPAVGNSDAHFIYEIGSLRTCFEGGDLREAIRTNQVGPCGNRPLPIGLPISKFLHHVRKRL